MITLKNLSTFFVFLMISSQACSELVDKTIVIVNDEVITKNQLSEEFLSIKKAFSEKGKHLPDTPEIRQQVLEKIILKSIFLQKAKEQHLEVTERQIDASVKRIADQNKLSLSKFRIALQNEGHDYTAIRDRIRNELTITQLQEKEAQRLTHVSDQEIKLALSQLNLSNNIEYRTAHILLPLPEAASPEQVSTQLIKANDLRQQLLEGADFTTLAQQHSAGQNALEGGDLGWRKKNELPSIFIDPILQMNLGEFSDAIRSPSGFHIIQLLEKRDAAQVLVTQTQARHILISPDAIQSEEEVLEKLNNLRDRIIQGGDFASIARANSIDHVSASKGGELGWVSKGQTVPQFEQTMNSLKINEVSEAFRSQYGWHIMQVTARRNIDKTDKYRFATIKQQLQKRKKQEALELWQKRLRDEAYVKFIK